MSYRCNRQYPCRHFAVLSGKWVCMLRADGRCVPNCKEYEKAVRP